MLKGKKVLLGISGSIAAYKSAILVRLLIKAGAEVKVIMTPSATDFIAPLTLSTLSKNEVLSELSVNSSWANHVMLGRWADIMLIAPLSCNTLAKMAIGLCDNLLMAVYLSAVCPVMVAPAMDEDMWLHPSTKKNISALESYGNSVIPVENGELASGLKGDGRMSEPENIIGFLNDHLTKAGQLGGKKVLVTAGPTYEAIDPVRFIGNHSSGKTGIAIADEFRRRGAEVTLVCGPVSEHINSSISVIKVTSAAEMYNACVDLFPQMDIAVMSAAVADYTIADPAHEKIKKKEDFMVISLEKTRDILKTLGGLKKGSQLLIGFALETNNERENALKKLTDKNADMIVLNSLSDPGAGFGHDTNKIIIFDKNGGENHFDTKSKAAIASDIINSIIKFSNG
ncbi:MAG: bifunctional phosphopantothenoylcysteine decarboxylase/phosphopantothenate--cysteine ligase CoaBC [Ferruginibacter sp.]|nr:bifunctional phosphopantothenoylcysteine decarboxylase/phosphopantothenate--cysteine ligase CoaBC [Ferruginibacter sp.]